MGRFYIEVADRHGGLSFDGLALKRILRSVLAEAVGSAELSVAVVGDAEMQQINRTFLGRDHPTDVMAFPYSTEEDHLEGEVVINADEALRQAAQRSHGAEDELQLYAVHGVLHLLGYDDADVEQRKRMHERELSILAAWGRALDS
jgi:probable rRNA maturation factor